MSLVEIWFVIVLILFLIIVAGAAFIIVANVRHAIRKSRSESTRPVYEYGNSLHDWEEACRRSDEWAKSRRHNGKEIM